VTAVTNCQVWVIRGRFTPVLGVGFALGSGPSLGLLHICLPHPCKLQGLHRRLASERLCPLAARSRR
jgi:hypothetical protein